MTRARIQMQQAAVVALDKALEAEAGLAAPEGLASDILANLRGQGWTLIPAAPLGPDPRRPSTEIAIPPEYESRIEEAD